MFSYEQGRDLRKEAILSQSPFLSSFLKFSEHSSVTSRELSSERPAVDLGNQQENKQTSHKVLQTQSVRIRTLIDEQAGPNTASGVVGTLHTFAKLLDIFSDQASMRLDANYTPMLHALYIGYELGEQSKIDLMRDDIDRALLQTQFYSDPQYYPGIPRLESRYEQKLFQREGQEHIISVLLEKGASIKNTHIFPANNPTLPPALEETHAREEVPESMREFIEGLDFDKPRDN